MAKKENKKPKVHDELDGLNIEINSFGEIVRSVNIDKINEFLDDNVEDKKLQDRSGEFGDQEEKKDEDEKK